MGQRHWMRLQAADCLSDLRRLKERMHIGGRPMLERKHKTAASTALALLSVNARTREAWEAPPSARLRKRTAHVLRARVKALKRSAGSNSMYPDPSVDLSKSTFPPPFPPPAHVKAATGGGPKLISRSMRTLKASTRMTEDPWGRQYGDTPSSEHPQTNGQIIGAHMKGVANGHPRSGPAVLGKRRADSEAGLSSDGAESSDEDDIWYPGCTHVAVPQKLREAAKRARLTAGMDLAPNRDAKPHHAGLRLPRTGALKKSGSASGVRQPTTRPSPHSGPLSPARKSNASPGGLVHPGKGPALPKRHAGPAKSSPHGQHRDEMTNQQVSQNGNGRRSPDVGITSRVQTARQTSAAATVKLPGIDPVSNGSPYSSTLPAYKSRPQASDRRDRPGPPGGLSWQDFLDNQQIQKKDTPLTGHSSNAIVGIANKEEAGMPVATSPEEALAWARANYRPLAAGPPMSPEAASRDKECTPSECHSPRDSLPGDSSPPRFFRRRPPGPLAAAVDSDKASELSADEHPGLEDHSADDHSVDDEDSQRRHHHAAENGDPVQESAGQGTQSGQGNKQDEGARRLQETAAEGDPGHENGVHHPDSASGRSECILDEASKEASADGESGSETEIVRVSEPSATGAPQDLHASDDSRMAQTLGSVSAIHDAPRPGGPSIPPLPIGRVPPLPIGPCPQQQASPSVEAACTADKAETLAGSANHTEAYDIWGPAVEASKARRSAVTGPANRTTQQAADLRQACVRETNPAAVRQTHSDVDALPDQPIRLSLAEATTVSHQPQQQPHSQRPASHAPAQPNPSGAATQMRPAGNAHGNGSANGSIGLRKESGNAKGMLQAHHAGEPPDSRCRAVGQRPEVQSSAGPITGPPRPGAPLAGWRMVLSSSQPAKPQPGIHGQKQVPWPAATTTAALTASHSAGLRPGAPGMKQFPRMPVNTTAALNASHSAGSRPGAPGMKQFPRMPINTTAALSASQPAKTQPAAPGVKQSLTGPAGIAAAVNASAQQPRSIGRQAALMTPTNITAALNAAQPQPAGLGMKQSPTGPAAIAAAVNASAQQPRCIGKQATLMTPTNTTAAVRASQPAKYQPAAPGLKQSPTGPAGIAAAVNASAQQPRFIGKQATLMTSTNAAAALNAQPAKSQPAAPGLKQFLTGPAGIAAAANASAQQPRSIGKQATLPTPTTTAALSQAAGHPAGHISQRAVALHPRGLDSPRSAATAAVAVAAASGMQLPRSIVRAAPAPVSQLHKGQVPGGLSGAQTGGHQLHRPAAQAPASRAQTGKADPAHEFLMGLHRRKASPAVMTKAARRVSPGHRDTAQAQLVSQSMGNCG